MFCVLRILPGCVFRSQPAVRLPDSLSYESHAQGNCQSPAGIFGKHAGSSRYVPVCGTYSGNPYRKSRDVLWNHGSGHGPDRM